MRVLNYLSTPLGLPRRQQRLLSNLYIIEYLEFARLELLTIGN